MLKIVRTGSYTDYPVKAHVSYGPWKEYIPESEKSFRKLAATIVSAFDTGKIGIRISSVNAALKYLGKASPRVDFESTVDEWIDAYWVLYRHHFICMGYSVDDTSLKQFFITSFNDRIRKSY